MLPCPLEGAICRTPSSSSPPTAAVRAHTTDAAAGWHPLPPRRSTAPTSSWATRWMRPRLGRWSGSGCGLRSSTPRSSRWGALAGVPQGGPGARRGMGRRRCPRHIPGRACWRPTPPHPTLPHPQVLLASHGGVSLEELDAPRDAAFAPMFKDAHSPGRLGSGAAAPTASASPSAPVAEGEGEEGSGPSGSSTPGEEGKPRAPAPGLPLRVVSAGSAQHAACGWLWAEEDVFDRGRLAAALAELASCPAVERVKGVFRCARAGCGGGGGRLPAAHDAAH
jgi:hypothetical protein